jgi:toxin-antitoxin system PIN domain toxin
VILLDANLLVYGHAPALPQHPAARTWLGRCMTESPRVGIAWPSLLAFVRLVCNPRIFERPQTVAQAWSRVEEWLRLPNVWIPLPTDQHATILARLILHVSNRSNLVPDAHLAALAMEHGLTLLTTDRDFARFPGLRWENPLEAP